MKRKACLAYMAALALGWTFGARGQSLPNQRPTIGVYPAEDRWITLTDGTKVYEGLEISYLLVTSLMATNQYNTILLDSSLTTSAPSPERLAQIPPEWIPPSAHGVDSQTGPDLTITPVVESLIYTSGDRSDRVVFGFSPDHLNPFNQGKEGSPDNEFVASSQQQADCVLPDFFNGTFTPKGYGPLAGNFGSNLDQGFSFQIGGYGIAFQQISFQVVSQIRFVIQNTHTQSSHDLVIQIVGSGQNVFVSGSYQGYTLGVTIQRRPRSSRRLINCYHSWWGNSFRQALNRRRMKQKCFKPSFIRTSRLLLTRMSRPRSRSRLCKAVSTNKPTG